MARKWHDLDAWWRKARKRVRVVRALAFAGVYSVVAGLAGASGAVIVLGCVFFALGGFILPDRRNAPHEAPAIVSAFSLCMIGAGILAYPLVFPQHKSAPPLPGAVRFSLRSDVGEQGDQSTVTQNLANPPNVNSQSPGEKVGTKQVKLLISNSYGHDITVTDIRVVDLKVGPPVVGTLFRNTAQGEVSNDLVGVDLSQHPPVVRQITAAGGLAGPLFGDSHLEVKAHGTEIVEVTMFAGAPRSYTWAYHVYFDVGNGQRSILLKGPPGLLALAGYAHSYRRIYVQGGRTWSSQPGIGFCTATGSNC